MVTRAVECATHAEGLSSPVSAQRLFVANSMLCCRNDLRVDILVGYALPLPGPVPIGVAPHLRPVFVGYALLEGLVLVNLAAQTWLRAKNVLVAIAL